MLYSKEKKLFCSLYERTETSGHHNGWDIIRFSFSKDTNEDLRPSWTASYWVFFSLWVVERNIAVTRHPVTAVQSDLWRQVTYSYFKKVSFLFLNEHNSRHY